MIMIGKNSSLFSKQDSKPIKFRFFMRKLMAFIEPSMVRLTERPIRENSRRGPPLCGIKSYNFEMQCENKRSAGVLLQHACAELF